LLTRVIKERRESAGLTQVTVATALGRYQSYVANIETGQRRIDVIEFLDLAQAIGVDPVEILREIQSRQPRQRKKTR
jgi:HTH-type transcriptional regulator/antitoxin HipB